ncbi:MAG: hypothetical protein CVV64_11855 [Candidatus Wallbacteria bacterium HGW-Wallbacteria-1]|jgi:hypothetical protein|uniref:SHOCT domain-containing protein n=1 Tax=Candidatus Wallbacteria bacterium HGW-Wallbacteria-1 TaxID=2013854 RepID=A0A2N1PNW3_9BACT|nr:MAG: hypothetical protein CVV64_11855 [Candidatus Wallbacteria bacterium HGW-Wallbacteria-1]
MVRKHILITFLLSALISALISASPISPTLCGEKAVQDHLTKLKTLQSMRDEGLISQIEFNKLKNRLLDSLTEPSSNRNGGSADAISAPASEATSDNSIRKSPISLRVAVFPPLHVDTPSTSGWIFREVMQEFQTLYPSETILFTGYSDILRASSAIFDSKGQCDFKKAIPMVKADLIILIKADHLSVTENVEHQDDLKSQISSGALLNLSFTFYSARNSKVIHSGRMRKRYAALAPASTLRLDLYPRIARYILARFRKKYHTLAQLRSSVTNDSPASSESATPSEKHSEKHSDKPENLKQRLQSLKSRYSRTK